MKVFLIIVAVIALLVILILSLSATLTLVYDNGWHTSIQVLFIEKDIVLSEVLSFILFPEKKAEEAREKSDNKKDKAKEEEQKGNEQTAKELENEAEKLDEKAQKLEYKADEKTDDKKEETKPQKPNYFQKLWDEEGVVGIMSFATNLFESASSAVTTLIKGFHIYSLYVKIIVGGSDAADIARDYGMICGFYYPLKGMILNGMKVDQYDDYIQADFIAPRNEYEFQLIGSLSVGLIVKMVLKAGIVFLKNFIKNK